MSKNLLKIYLLSALGCSSVFAVDQQVEAQRLDDAAVAVMRVERLAGILHDEAEQERSRLKQQAIRTREREITAQEEVLRQQAAVAVQRRVQYAYR